MLCTKNSIACLLLLLLGSASPLAVSYPRQDSLYWRDFPIRMVAAQPAAHYSAPRSGVATRAGPRLQLGYPEKQPYLKQPIVVTIRIVSRRALAYLSITIPDSPLLTILPLGDPSAKAIFQQGRQQVVTEYHYLYTPLESGALRLPVIEARGALIPTRQFPRQQSKPFTLYGPTEQVWQVRPAEIANREDWLPVHHLALSDDLEAGAMQKLAKGEMARYTLIVTAIGTTGDLLPSAAASLQGPDFAVHSEKVEYATWRDKQGALQAQRLETFTLQPKRNGLLRIPSVGLSWWNIEQQRAEHARLPTHSVRVNTASLEGKNAVKAVPTLPENTINNKILALFIVILIGIGWWIIYGSRKLSKVQWSDEFYPTLRAKPPKRPEYVRWTDALYPTLRAGGSDAGKKKKAEEDA